MIIEEHQFPDRLSPAASLARPEPSTDVPLSHAAGESELSKLEGLLQSVVSAPPEQMDIAVVPLVRKAMKARHRLSVLLALRAMRLEQKLRDAQRRVIELQWELAQLRRCVRPREVED